MFRNDLVVQEDGKRILHFTDVTEQSGIDIQSYGMGVATGDFNNDGCIDIYRTGLSGSRLLRNNCDGTFTDVTKQSGAEDRGGWGVSGGVRGLRPRRLAGSVRRQLSQLQPRGRHPLPERDGPAGLLPAEQLPARSRAGSITTAGTGRSRTSRPKRSWVARIGPALGVSTADFNGDGWIDIYVGNDGEPNQLWINQRERYLQGYGAAGWRGRQRCRQRRSEHGG